MIKNVIKRDGRVEEFSAEKINSWIQWSEKTVNPKDFNWSTIVLKTISTLPEQVTTKELQEALIRECLNQDTWEGSRMAGRLYASALSKELYETRKHPHIQELHKILYEKSIIIDTSLYYTDEEYDEINKMLLHRKDYTYSHYAINQLVKKYSLKDRVSKITFETPQFIYMRVVMQTFLNYHKPDRLEKMKSLYEDLCYQRINVPTPYFANSLTANPNVASCFLPHTLVDLETCRKKISEVEVGSKVLTHTGQFKTVIDKFSRIYSGKMVQINTVASYINEFESTYNHRIYAIKATSPELIKQTSKCKPEWIEADHIRVGDYIKLGVNLDVYDKPTTIWDIIHNNYLVKDYVIENDKIKKIILTGKDRGQSFKKHPETNNINIFDKELFRLIGYYLAEGCITKPERQNSENFQLTFGTKEEVFINDAINIVYHLFGIKLSRYDNPSDNSTKLQTYNKPLCALMLELCNTGFDKKYLHDLILKAPRELQEELLVGVIRGDGCSTISGFRLSLTNKELIYQLKNIALRCNIHISMSGGIQSTRYPDKKPSCILQFNVDGLSDFAKKVNKNIDKIRKNKSCSGLHIVFREDGIFARAREISSYYIENQEVWDLTVEDDHSFIVNSLTVHNCSVITCEDEAESIGVENTLAYTLTTAGSGVGAHFKTRSLNDPVRNGLVKHAGKIPYFRAFANIMKSSTQGTRSGASTIHFPTFDPEINNLIRLKNPLTPLANRVRESDYSIGLNKEFIKRAILDKPFWLFSYKTNPELYEKFYHADSQKFDSLLEQYSVTDPDKVKEVSASGLLSDVMTNRAETARLYVHLADTINKQTPYKETIYSSNLCIAGNQLVPSDKGLLTAEELNQLNTKLILVDGKTQVKSSPMKLRETSQDVYKITLKNGMSHTVTDYHKIMTDKGLVQCKDLIVGKHKAKINIEEGIFGSRDMIDEAYLLGLWQGDGTSSGEFVHIDIWEDKTECLKDEILEIYSRVRAKYTNNEYDVINQTGKVVGKRQYGPVKFIPCTQVGSKAKWRLSSTILKKYLNFEKNILPRWLREGNKETQLAYVKGLFQTDGTYSYSSNVHHLGLVQISKDYLEELQILLNNLGYSFTLTSHSKGGLKLLPDSQRNLKEYECKGSYRLVAGSFHTCLKFEEDTGFITFRGKTLPEPIKQIYKPKEFIDIISIEYEGKEDVYCPTVETDEHLFVSHCFITRNCQEIALPTKPYLTHLDLYNDEPEGVVAFCNLAGLNIPNIKDDEEYERACYNALLMIEHGIENNNLPFPALNANLKDYRSAGVGIVGLAYLMAKKGLSYTTQEGKDFIFEQAERYGYFVTKAATKITEEYGIAKRMDRNKYPEGWLPMDDASPAALALTTKSLQYDWEDLRNKIKSLGGLRFTSLMAIAPAESSSIACSLTNSIYPIRSLTLTKTSGDTTNKWVAPEATRLAKKYEIAWDIPNFDHIDVYALFQIFMDQTISSDLYSDRTKEVNISMAQMFKELAYMAKMGVKTLYYHNSLTDSEESTDFVNSSDKISEDVVDDIIDDEEGCGSGGCTL